jgi:N-acetylmuramoyl-L-alanine amidase
MKRWSLLRAMHFGAITTCVCASIAVGLGATPAASQISTRQPDTATIELAQLAAPAAVAATSGQTAALPASDALLGDTRRTRFVIGLEKSAEFHVFALTSPNRVIVELPDVKMQLPVHGGDAPVGLVRSFRGGLSAPGKSRIVIDVTAPVVVEGASIEKAKDGRSHRLVLDIVPVDALTKSAEGTRRPLKTSASALGAIGVQPPLPKAAQRPDRKAANEYKPLIVIDPGHGGQDSGAIKWGTVEKDVVLAFSKALREKLLATGRYKVMMTRDDDTFVDLDARREIAERNNAALFIAVHADYAGSGARGATIYSLKENVANDLKRSAKGEVTENVLSAKELTAMRKSESDVSAVQGILADLAQREVNTTKERTSVFSRSVIDYMGATTNMQNNPDRSAAFRVLKTAKVPAVLIELAYVSNQQDAKNLKSDEWRNKVSGSIMTAIENYFSNQIARLPM